MDEPRTTAVIDRALEQGAATAIDPIERELEELTLALMADRPAPAPELVAELDERVRQGFPRERGAITTAPALGTVKAAPRALRSKLAGTLLERPPMALLGGVASLLLVLAVVVSLSGDEATSPDSGGSVAAIEEAPSADSDASAGAKQDTAPGPPGKAMTLELAPDGAQSRAYRFARPTPRRGFAPGTRDRRIARSATLALAAPVDELDSVADEIATITERNRGFVLRSSLATGDEGIAIGGDFELRIPATRLQRSLDQLAKLGQVRARTQAGDDVTAAFVTTGDQLQAARAERRSLLTRLEGADTDLEAEALRLQLDANAGEINRLRGRIRSLQIKTDYAKVNVTLEAQNGAGATPGDGLGGALDDALGSRATLRRRRESALS